MKLVKQSWFSLLEENDKAAKRKFSSQEKKLKRKMKAYNRAKKVICNRLNLALKYNDVYFLDLNVGEFSPVWSVSTDVQISIKVLLLINNILPPSFIFIFKQC